MTFDEILHAAYDDQGYQSFRSTPPSEPGPDVVARFKRWANEGVRDIVGRPRLAPLRHGTFEFMSEAGVGTYGIDPSFDAIDTIVQPTNDRRLRNMSRDWYRSIDPGERSQGTSWAWIEEGYSPVRSEPSSGSTGIWASSSSPVDTGGPEVHIEGLATAGTSVRAHVALAGTTPVLLSPFPFAICRTFFLSAPCVGGVQIFDPVTVPITVFSGITPGLTSMQWHHIRLWPTPSAAEPYRLDGQLKAQPLVNPNDEPWRIPTLYHGALVDWINFCAYMKNGDTERAQVARATYERKIGEMTNKLEFSADYRPIRGGLGPDTRRWSNLPGGYFPADGWGR